MSKATADWERVDDRFYRKIQLYTAVFDHDLELENYIFAGAPYAGAIAVYRDESKIQTYRTTQVNKPGIDIYTCAGKLIRHISWDKGSIKGLGWSEEEKLIVVTEDGTVRCYYGLQGDFIPFTLGHGAESYGVRSCRFWSSGFVALLGNNHLIEVSRYDEPRPRLLAIPPPDPVMSWSIIPPAYTLSRSVEVILAVKKTVLVVDASDSQDRLLQNGPFVHVSVSPNGKFVALYTEDGKVWVISSDFENKLSEYSSGSKVVPNDVQWCGNSAVVLAWDDEVHLLGPNGAVTKFYYDCAVHLTSDIDGIRLFTNDVCEFLQKVPAATEETFRPGSSSPSSILLDAADQLEKGSPKADDNIQLIRPNLIDAVDTCIRAAGHEFSIHWQKQLLKAASFGKSVLDVYDSDQFVEMTETLRVLNAVRFYSVGIPLSYEQYTRLGPERLVHRLADRQEYLLALRIAEYTRLPTDKIYIHWATQKVRVSNADDATICRILVEKLSNKRGISFTAIARAANDEGRSRLATELLNYEPRAGKQVPLLLTMEEDQIALDEAIESGDTDLVFFVLLQMKKKLPLSSFFRTINSRPTATALVESSASEQDRELLKDLYYQDDRRLDGAYLLVSEALRQRDPAAVSDKIKLATRLLQDSKEHTFQVKALDETQRLLRVQEAFEKDLGVGTFVGLSTNESLFRLIRLGHMKRASKLQAEFKVPEKTSWWIRLRALTAKRDWHELEEISKVKKSPIGWEPFFNEVLGAGNPKLAGVFVARCTGLSSQERVEMWVKCGQVAKAGEEALRAKDVATLEGLRTKATGSAIAEIERMISQLRGGRK